MLLRIMRFYLNWTVFSIRVRIEVSEHSFSTVYTLRLMNMSCLIVGADPLAVESEPLQKVRYQTTVTALVCMHNVQIIYCIIH
mgnify:CR=1 FL=1